MTEETTSRLRLAISDLPSHSLLIQRPPAKLYHYTNASGLHGIISSRSLWLSKIQNLNDRSELLTGIYAFRCAVDRILKQLQNVHEKDYIIQVRNQLNCFTQTNICIASFCENGNLLSQWRGYCSNGLGFSLGFDSELLCKRISGTRISLYKCIYSPEQHQLIANELVSLVMDGYRQIEPISPNNLKKKNLNDLTGWFNTLFLSVAPFLKNEHFHEEAEWRLVSSSIPCTDADFKVRVRGSALSEYFEIAFPSPDYDRFIKNITVGPSENLEAASSAASTMCRKYSVNCETVTSSQIPFRAV